MIPSKHQFVGQKVKLSDICSIVSGATPKTTVKDYWGGDIKWITPSELNDDSHVIYNTAKHLTEAGFASARLRMFPEGTVLLTTRAPIGKVAIAGDPMCCNQGFKNLVCSDAVNNEYLYRYLKNRSSELQVLGRGATFKELSKKEVAAYEINLPPLKRQLEAVEKLALVDKQVVIAKTQLDKLDSLVKSRFVEMFDGTSFPIKRLEDVAEIQGGLTKNKRRDSLALKLPYLRVANVLKSGIDTSEMKSIGLTEQEYEATKLMKDDLLFVEGNGSSDQIGRSAIWDGEIDFCVHQNHLIRARFGESVLPAFAQAYFSSSAGRDQIISRAVSTSGLMTLSTGKIKSLRIPVPSLELQGSFVDFAAQVDKSRFAGTFTGTINVKNYAISCSVHNNSGRIPNEALHSAREVTEYALLELQELYDSLTQKYFAL